MEILIKRLQEHAKLPAYDRPASAGIDLYALDEVTLEPGERVTVATGVALALPVGYIGVIWNQHSLIIGEPVQVTTSILESGHREEVQVELTNNGTEARTYAAGEKIAQLFVQKTDRAALIEVEEFNEPTPEE